MPMTKQERDELRAACEVVLGHCSESGVKISRHGKTVLDLKIAQLRELLDEAERLEKVIDLFSEAVVFGRGAELAERLVEVFLPQGEPEG